MRLKGHHTWLVSCIWFDGSQLCRSKMEQQPEVPQFPVYHSLDIFVHVYPLLLGTYAKIIERTLEGIFKADKWLAL